jgi:hypothetical protein
MLKLTPHAYPEPATQLALLTNRNGERNWAAVVQVLLDRFAVYRAALPALSRLVPPPPLVVANEVDLTGIYASEAGVARGIKEAVRKLSETQCPYCGEPSSPTQVDHFLPQSEFPEFAFFSQNLVPSCDGCNLTKRTDIWDACSNARLFLHPFIDEFLNSPFFHLGILPDAIFGYNVPVFDAVWDQVLVPSPVDRQRCETHFEKLDVVKRVRAHVVRRCNTLRYRNRELVAALELDSAVFAVELDALHDSEVNTGAPNSWDALTYRSIRRCPDYLQFICTVPFDPAAQ